jgi:hypothetical protein
MNNETRFQTGLIFIVLLYVAKAVVLDLAPSMRQTVECLNGVILGMMVFNLVAYIGSTYTKARGK